MSLIAKNGYTKYRALILVLNLLITQILIIFEDCKKDCNNTSKCIGFNFYYDDYGTTKCDMIVN